MRAPAADDAQLADDDTSNNNFGFSNSTPVVTLKDGTQASTAYPRPPADPNGRTCPFVGHIRKVNPRDDNTEQGGPRDTLHRLMLRRGIPYGPPQDRTRLMEDDGVDRGLLFMAYQGAIADQFQFVTHTWANQPDAPHHGEPKTGHDPLIGQKVGARFIRLPIDGDVDRDQQIDLPEDPWVVMTGGGYFFTPSVSALAGPLTEEMSSAPRRRRSRTGGHGQPARRSVQRRSTGPRNTRGEGL
jgi:deferrochelatase/peroxidase EfeB